MGQRVRVWQSATKGAANHVGLPHTWAAGATPPLFVEGVQTSGQVRDVELRIRWNHVVLGAILECRSTIRLTVVNVEIDVADVPEPTEEAVGYFIGRNQDDDNQNGVPDQGEAPVANEDDLRPVTVVVLPPELEGMFTLTLEPMPGVPASTGALQAWEDAGKGVAAPLGPMPIPAAPVSRYLEGIATSSAVRDIRLVATYTDPLGHVCVDRLPVTVVEVDINPAPGQAGVTGDEVPGMLTGGAPGTPQKHYVSPQGQGSVVLQADVLPAGIVFQQVFEWVGGQAGQAADLREAPRAAPLTSPSR